MTDQLIKIFSEELSIDSKQLNEDSSPETIEAWDSLAAMNLVAAIEEAFEIRLTTLEIMKMNSIGQARLVLTGKGVAILPSCDLP